MALKIFDCTIKHVARIEFALTLFRLLRDVYTKISARICVHVHLSKRLNNIHLSPAQVHIILRVPQKCYNSWNPYKMIVSQLKTPQQHEANFLEK